MHHQPHASLSSSEIFLLSLPHPSLASSLSDNPTAYIGQTTDSLDSVANVQNFIVYQVCPIKYGPVVESSQETADMPATFRSAWNDSWVHQILTNETPIMLPNQTKIDKPMRCEVCRIDFNSKSVFENHLSGKEHKRNMQFYDDPSNTILSGTSNVNSQIQPSSVQGQELFVHVGMDLGSEKQKLSRRGEAEHVDQVDLTSGNWIDPKKIKAAQRVRCEICMINCNSKDAYISHLSGKKHRRNEEKLSKSKSDGAGVGADANASVAGATAATVAANSMQQVMNQVIEPQEKQDTSKQEGINSHKLENAVMLEAPKEDIETKKQKLEANVNSKIVFNLPEHPARCEICLIKCNNKHAYIAHLSGKKHRRNLEKLSKTKNDGVDASVIGTPAAIATSSDGVDASVVGTTAALAMANDMQLVTNPAIESQEKPDNSKEGINSHQPENAVMLEASEEDIETKKRKCELEGGAATTPSKFCNLSNVNSNIVFNLPDHPAQCEICLIKCNSKHAYTTHLSGKKHRRNLQKLSKTKNDGDGASVVGATATIVTTNDMQPARNPAIESQEKPNSSKQEMINSHQPENGVLVGATKRDIETRKRKCELEGWDATTLSKLRNLSNIASEIVFNLPDHPTRCEICMIDCDSRLAYITHFSGKKHLRKLEQLSKSKNVGADASVFGATTAIATANDMQEALNPAIEPQENLDNSQQEGINSQKPEDVVMSEAPEKDIETKKRKHEGEAATSSSYNRFNINSEKVLNLPDGSTWCEICLINCNTKHAYMTHLSGKKHVRNLEKLSAPKDDGAGAGASVAGAVAAIITASDMQKAANLAVNPQGDLNTSQREGIISLKPENLGMLEVPEKDIGTKKCKLEHGGSATTFFKECSLCGILCNSDRVYNSHLEGKKHAAMVKKQAKSTTCLGF